MKLVRDKIPDIIRGRGDECRVRKCDSDAEFHRLLFKKLAEELREAEGGDVPHLTPDWLLEELADVTEVVHALLALNGWTLADLERMRRKKHKTNGGFTKRLVLEEWWKR